MTNGSDHPTIYYRVRKNGSVYTYWIDHGDRMGQDYRSVASMRKMTAAGIRLKRIQ